MTEPESQGVIGALAIIGVFVILIARVLWEVFSK